MKWPEHIRIALLIGLLSLTFSLFGQENCIDLRDLSAPYIHCTWGTFEDPYLNQGVIEGRHTIITDTLATDPRTHHQVYMVPPSEAYSVKLGNELGGSQAESIAVDIEIDTSQFNLLILKYAAVLEDGGHNLLTQPRFTFEILDMQNQLIDSACLFTSIAAGSNPGPGWTYIHPFCWKDWTHVGVDLASFHGQTIRVRLTTYDCYVTIHCGYAYFLLTCGNKGLENISCGNTGLYRFSAPDGFNYRWYWRNNPSQTLSSNRTVDVPINATGVLRCHASYIDNDECFFETDVDLDTVSPIEPRYPIAGFSMEQTDCPQTIHFIDGSFVSLDGTNPDGTGNHCGNVLWDFGDGNTSTAPCPFHKYTASGDFTVTMVAGLGDFMCTDTLRQPVHIPENTRIDTLACDAFVWNGTTLTESGVYSHAYDTQEDCDSLVELHLTVVNSVVFLRDTTACDLFAWNDSLYSIPGSYTQTFPRAHGCDSIVTLNLDLNYTPLFDIQGAHYVVGGSEWGFTEYPYSISLLHPLCQPDSVSWTVDCPNMAILPQGNGLSAKLRVFTMLGQNDSIPINAAVHNPCGTMEKTFWVHTTAYGNNEHAEAPRQLSVSPNPSTGLLNLSIQGLPGIVSLEIYNTDGLMVMAWDASNPSGDTLLHLDCSRLPNGFYTLRAYNNDAVLTKKIVIRK